MIVIIIITGIIYQIIMVKLIEKEILPKDYYNYLESLSLKINNIKKLINIVNDYNKKFYKKTIIQVLKNFNDDKTFGYNGI